MQKIGKYEILQKIGEGAMGIVYKALDPVIERIVAVKTMSADLDADPELRQRFFREARSAGQLSHKNIITIYDLGEEGGRAYMAMEFLEGEDLRKKLARRELVSIPDKVKVITEMCEGIAHAHANGVIHRDIKPGNIFIVPGGHVKILDFGLARIASSEVTKAGAVMGTPSYMSPEQIRGDRVDRRSDIFSLGSVCYEVLTSRKPFNGTSLPATFFKITQEEPEPIGSVDPALPKELTQIVHRALIKNPDARYQTVDEILADLDRMRSGWVAQPVDVERTAQFVSARTAPRPRVGAVIDSIEVRPADRGEEQEKEQRTRRLVAQADALAAKGDLTGAVTILESAEAAIAADSRVTAALARVREELRVRDDARRRDEWIQQRFQDGQSAFDRHDYTGCVDVMNELLAAAPGHREAAEYLAAAREWLEREREEERRRDLLSKIMQSAEAALSAGKLEKAGREAERAIAIDADDPAVQALRARISQLEEQQRAAQDARNRAEELMKEARAHLSSKRPEDASRALGEAVVLWPDQPGAANLRAKIEKEIARQSAEAQARAAQPETTRPLAVRQGVRGRAKLPARWGYGVAILSLAGAVIAGVMTLNTVTPGVTGDDKVAETGQKQTQVVAGPGDPAAVDVDPQTEQPKVVLPDGQAKPEEAAILQANSLLERGQAEEAKTLLVRAFGAAPASAGARDLLVKIDARLRSDLDDAMRQARAARGSAEQARAGVLANESYERARKLELEGKRFSDAGQYVQATVQFKAAVSAYEGAAGEARVAELRVSQQEKEVRRQDAAAHPADDRPHPGVDAGAIEKAVTDSTSQKQAAEEAKLLAEARLAAETARKKAPGAVPQASGEMSKGGSLAEQGRLSDAAAAYHRAAALYDAAARSAAGDTEAITKLLRSYSAAIQEKNLEALRSIWPSLGEREESKIKASFGFTRSHVIELTPISFELSGDTATVVCQRRDDLITVQGDRVPNQSKATFSFRKGGGSWVIDAIR
ncbi:MAG: protein kinase [Acidobacteria bacterium]|nr:protein kinase [Acidobacteriota bacterium]